MGILSGIIPQEMGNLWNLRSFSFDFLSLRGNIPESIFNISKLEIISAVSCNLSGKLPPNFGHNLPNLSQMGLGNNSLTGILPDSISNATQLMSIDILFNKFTGTIPKSLGNLRLLEYLNLGSNNFTIEKPSSELDFFTSLTNCKNLRLLSVYGSSLNGYLPVSIGNFSSSLKQLYAYNCGIQGTIPNEIGNLSSLTILSLYGNELSGKIPTIIKELSNLQVLALGDNRIGGSIPEDLCYLQNLGILYAAVNQISGSLPACLGNISSLRYLRLGSNRLTSSLPAELGNLKDLLEFSVPKNCLTDHLPLELGNLKVVILLDLSYNQFSGHIPSILGGLQNLITLSLAKNRLQGPIPDIFKYMVSLEYLDLAGNNLSGMIPKSLETLVYLVYFNVSTNSLSGDIPNSGPFKNFTSLSFLRNKALCGAPRFQVPLCHPKSFVRGSKRKRVLRAICISLVTGSIFFTWIFAFVLIRRRMRSKVPSQTDLSPVIAPFRISYYELQQATDSFSECNLLGTGSFGSVYKGVLPDGTFVGIKVFNIQLEGGFKGFDVECEVLRNLRHRNICKVISTCSNLDFKALILEYMSNGSLEKWLYSHNHFLDILQRIDIMIDVACALNYLHHGYSTTTVVHCDLKPSNVLLDENMVARLSDFGIAKLLGEGDSIAHTATLATFGYIAPEYGLEGLVSRKCDIYSYGILLMEIFTRTKPSDEQFHGDLNLKRWVSNSLPESVIHVIDSNLISLEDENLAAKTHCVSSIMELAMSCSAEAPEDRFEMSHVLATLKKIKIQLLANLETT